MTGDMKRYTLTNGNISCSEQIHTRIPIGCGLDNVHAEQTSHAGPSRLDGHYFVCDRFNKIL